MFDVQKYYAKVAVGEIVTENEIAELVKELVHFRGAAAYLASCQAATLESLPKSTSKSSRERHVNICETAAKILVGDASRVRYPTDMTAARERCLKAVAGLSENNHLGNQSCCELHDVFVEEKIPTNTIR